MGKIKVKSVRDANMIRITNFFTGKQLKKIDKIINTSTDVADACDRLEDLFEDTKFKAMDAGTNRYVWKHKDIEGVIFKIAADKHGIEANYREFYISSLDKRLTDTYSISDNGTIIVQEEVERILDQEKADKYRKRIKKMLDKLSEKILCVDCQLKNFKNFGIRKLKDGDKVPVLLDYGDCVPLADYQDFSQQVNFNEEMNCSLRCRAVYTEKGTAKKKQCKGTLHPNDDYSRLVCDECGMSFTFDQAYRECILDSFKKKKNIESLDCDTTEAEAIYTKYMAEQNRKFADDIMKLAVDIVSKDDDIPDGYFKSADGYTFKDSDYSSFLKKKMYAKLKAGEITGLYFIKTILDKDPSEFMSNNSTTDNVNDTHEPVSEYSYRQEPEEDSEKKKDKKKKKKKDKDKKKKKKETDPMMDTKSYKKSNGFDLIERELIDKYKNESDSALETTVYNRDMNMMVKSSALLQQNAAYKDAVINNINRAYTKIDAISDVPKDQEILGYIDDASNLGEEENTMLAFHKLNVEEDRLNKVRMLTEEDEEIKDNLADNKKVLKKLVMGNTGETLVETEITNNILLGDMNELSEYVHAFIEDGEKRPVLFDLVGNKIDEFLIPVQMSTGLELHLIKKLYFLFVRSQLIPLELAVTQSVRLFLKKSFKISVRGWEAVKTLVTMNMDTDVGLVNSQRIISYLLSDLEYDIRSLMALCQHGVFSPKLIDILAKEPCINIEFTESDYQMIFDTNDSLETMMNDKKYAVQGDHQLETLYQARISPSEYINNVKYIDNWKNKETHENNSKDERYTTLSGFRLSRYMNVRFNDMEVLEPQYKLKTQNPADESSESFEDVVLSKADEAIEILKAAGKLDIQPEVKDSFESLESLINQSSVDDVARNIVRHKILCTEVVGIVLDINDDIVKLQDGETVGTRGTDICNFANSEGYLLTTLASLGETKGILIQCDDKTSVKIDPYKQIYYNQSSIVSESTNLMTTSEFTVIDSEEDEDYDKYYGNK